MIEVNDKKIEWHKNMTIAELLEKTDNKKFCSAVRLNNRLVSSPNFNKILIPDNSKIYILPPIAGG